MLTLDSAAESSSFEPGSRSRRQRLRPRARQVLLVLAMFALSRVFSSVLLALALWVVLANGWHIPSYFESPSFLVADGAGYRHDPNFFTFSGLWDGEYYRLIAAHGYPSVLPRGANGDILPNPWAFLPVYPLIVRGIDLVTGLGFFSVGAVVSAVFGAAAAVVLYLLVRDRVGHRPAWFTAVVFSFGPLAFLLQATYAESLFFFLMFSAMYLMQRRSYWLMMIPAALAAFTRPGEVALALALAVVFVVRLREARWGRDTVVFPVAQRVGMIAAAAVAVVTGLAWPVIAAVATGVPNAYVATETAWRTGFIGHVRFVPFAAWFELGGRYLGVVGVLIVVVAMLGFARWLTRPRMRALGAPILASTASFVLYLLAVFMPQQSFFRVVVPAAPLLGDPALSANRHWRRAIVYGGMALQPACIALVWYLANP